MAADMDGIGLRRRVTIAGERYYFIATKDENNRVSFCCTVPDENKPVGKLRRETADVTCKVLSEMVNAILGVR